jgi:hypothetical protein
MGALRFCADSENGQPRRTRGLGEVSVPGDESGVVLVHLQGGREVDSVVAAKGESLRMTTGRARQLFIDFEPVQFAVQILEIAQRPPIARASEAVGPTGSCQSSTASG